MYLLITYDIVDDKNRRKVDRLLSAYGTRVNYSVFEVEIKKHIYTLLLTQLQDLLTDDDSIRVYHIDRNTLKNALELNNKRTNPFEHKDLYV